MLRLLGLLCEEFQSIKIMLNLLPKKQKQELHLDLLSQVIIITALSVIFMVLILVLLLFIGQRFLSLNIESMQRELDMWQSKSEIKDLEDLEGKIKNLNKNLVFLDNSYKTRIEFSTFLDNLAQDTPMGVRFDDIFVNDLGEVHLNGFSTTRKIILSFRDILENAFYVKDLDFPLANLTKEFNVNFSLSFVLKHEL